MKTTKSLALALSMTLGVASGSFAQGGMGTVEVRGGGRMYDPKTVETISGEVVGVEAIHGKGWTGQGRRRGRVRRPSHPEERQGGDRSPPGTELVSRQAGTEDRPGRSHRGSWFAHHVQGKPAIIAAEVKKGDQSLRLRDDDGLPAWRGQVSADRDDRRRCNTARPERSGMLTPGSETAAWLRWLTGLRLIDGCDWCCGTIATSVARSRRPRGAKHPARRRLTLRDAIRTALAHNRVLNATRQQGVAAQAGADAGARRAAAATRCGRNVHRNRTIRRSSSRTS